VSNVLCSVKSACFGGGGSSRRWILISKKKILKGSICIYYIKFYLADLMSLRSYPFSITPTVHEA
jgi:hypothetical protein